MNTAKTKRKIKTLTVSIAACMALIFGAVFSFGAFGGKYSAADDDEPPVTNEVGLRFVQVAAGENFAIGLTYDNRLFGWSLNESSTGGDTTSTATLGTYYSSVPTEINVNFVLGPGSSGTNTWSEVTYHNPDTNGRIITQIATTRTTAAFITDNGYIYTWGKDTPRDLSAPAYKNAGYDGNKVYNYLLLRTPDTDHDWYEPYIIQYDYYYQMSPESGQKETALSGVLAKSSNYSDFSIAGGENNYIYVYKNGSYHSYVWGSMMYANVQAEDWGSLGGYDFQDTGSTNQAYNVTDDYFKFRYVYQTRYAGSDTATAVAGGYNVAINGSNTTNLNNATSLMLRGRNFLTTGELKADTTHDGDGYTAYSPTVTVATSTAVNGTSSVLYSQGSNKYRITDGIIGGNAVGTVSNGILPTASGTYYGTQLAKEGGSASDNLVYSVVQPAESGVYDASGAADPLAAKVGASSARSIKTVRNAVSLGNDIGYGISNGTLFAWGDNACGQSGSGTKGGNNSYPTEVTTLSGTVLSVAAGKQLSAGATVAGPKAFNYDETLDTSSGVAFSSAVKNQEAFITGAIVKDGTQDAGTLYVWSDKKPTPEPLRLGGANAVATDKASNFTAVYSGYGANLFAITTLGKVVRVSYDATTREFTHKMYDTFRNADGSTVNNWSVAEKGANTVKVAGLATGEDGVTPDSKLASFTLFVNNGVSDKSSTTLNAGSKAAGEPMYYGSDRGSLVTENAIGDVYRILDYKNDSTIKYLVKSDPEKTLSKDELTPKFFFKASGQTAAVDMSEEQRKYMFDYDIAYDDEYGVGIKILPKQSTKLGTVTVEFYIARYDSKANFVVTGDARPASDDAQYFDYKKCRVDFVIDNSAAFQTFKAFRGDNGEGNANIPLLDPNNDYNRVYSLAVQNISAGVDVLAGFLAGGNKSDLLKKITDEMIKQDAGYPDKDKIDKGNLNYYLGATEANHAYSGSYQWLFTDIDADVVRVNSLSEEFFGGAVRGSVTRSAPSVTIVLDDLDSFNIDKATADKFFTDFNNVYGIHSVKFTLDEANSKVTGLEFSYDVITFTAENTTGALLYNSASVSDYATTDIDGNARLSFTFDTYYEYTKYTADYYTDLTANDENARKRASWSNFADVFAQSSVRLKANDGHGHSLAPVGGGSVAYGDASEGKNEVHIVDNTAIPVGSSYVIDLSRYVNKIGSYISFSYKDQNSDFSGFNNQFPDVIGGSTDTCVTLTGTTITIKPTRAYDLYFTVSIQRFYGAENSVFGGGDEKIELVFSFTGITPVSLRDITTVSTFPLSREGVIDLFGRTGRGTADAVNQAALIELDQRYNGNIKLEGLKSSNTKVLTTNKLSEKAFRVTPKESGVAIVQFVVTVYDKHVPFTLTFNVSGITNVTTGSDKGSENLTVALSGTEYVYISTLKTALQNAVGKFNDAVENYTVMYTDITDGGMLNAIYFTEWDESTNTESEPILGFPSYVKNVTFQDYSSGNDDKAYIRIAMDDEASDMSKVYKMHVKFVDGTANYTSYEDAKEKNGAILEAAFVVKSTKQIAMGENGGMLHIEADVDHPKAQNANNINSDWYVSGSNTDAKIIVPLEYLFACAGLQVDNYSVFLVTAPENATDYINYTFDSGRVIITPLYNTPDDAAIALNVSTKSSRSGESNQVITFSVSVKGISTTLSKQEYTTIWLVAFFSSFGLLFVIFIIRLIVYWRRRAKQRALIKRNQELIKMRDRIHNRAGIATREQVVKTKLKMEDPKYAKMFGEMKRDKNGDPGVTLESSDFGATDDDKKSKKKKKKGGKKSIAELKAELEAKKAAFAQAQQGGGADGQPFGGQPFGDGASSMDAPVFEAQSYGAVPTEGFGSPTDGFSQSDLDGNAIIFDATDDGAQG